MEQTRRQKLASRDKQERAKLINHLNRMANSGGFGAADQQTAGDKYETFQFLRKSGFSVPESCIPGEEEELIEHVGFPLIVKPPQEDASLGIRSNSVVHDLRELFTRIDALQSEFQQPVLVEEFVEGREFYVGVLGNANVRALPVMELDFSGFPAGVPRIASWEAKWGDDGAGSGEQFAGTRSIFPVDLAPELTTRMQEVAVEAFNALRLRDYARIDLRVTEQGEIFVIEVNPNCYLERESEFARAAAEGGLAYDALIARILELALARYSH